MRKLILFLVVGLFFAAGSASANVLIGEATFKDASYNFATTGGLNSNYLNSFTDNGSYYGVIEGFYKNTVSPYWNPPSDGTVGHFMLSLDLDLLGGNNPVDYIDTIDLGTHLWSDMKTAFNTCFDYVSGSGGIVVGLKQSCFDSNILNKSDVTDFGNGTFNGTVKLFMATAVPAPGALALFGFGVVLVGFTVRRRRCHA